MIDEGREIIKKMDRAKDTHPNTSQILEEEKIIIIGDSLMAHGVEHMQEYKEKYKLSYGAQVHYKRGANVEEILGEAQKVEFGEKGGILVIQGGGGIALRKTAQYYSG